MHMMQVNAHEQLEPIHHLMHVKYYYFDHITNFQVYVEGSVQAPEYHFNVNLCY